MLGSLVSLLHLVFLGTITFSDATGLHAFFLGFSSALNAIALPLLFLAIVLLLRERYNAFASMVPHNDVTGQRLSVMKTFDFFHGAIAFVMFAIGAASDGILIHLVQMIDTGFLSDRDNIIRFGDINQNMQYSYAAILVCAMLDIVALTIFVRRSNKLQGHNKVCTDIPRDIVDSNWSYSGHTAVDNHLAIYIYALRHFYPYFCRSTLRRHSQWFQY